MPFCKEDAHTALVFRSCFAPMHFSCTLLPPAVCLGCEQTREMRSVTVKLSIWTCWQLFWQPGQIYALRFWEAFDHWLAIQSSRSFSNKPKNVSFLMEVFIFLEYWLLLLRKGRFLRASSEKPTCKESFLSILRTEEKIIERLQ